MEQSPGRRWIPYKTVIVNLSTTDKEQLALNMLVLSDRMVWIFSLSYHRILPRIWGPQICKPPSPPKRKQRPGGKKGVSTKIETPFLLNTSCKKLSNSIFLLYRQLRSYGYTKFNCLQPWICSRSTPMIFLIPLNLNGASLPRCLDI